MTFKPFVTKVHNLHYASPVISFLKIWKNWGLFCTIWALYEQCYTSSSIKGQNLGFGQISQIMGRIMGKLKNTIKECKDPQIFKLER